MIMIVAASVLNIFMLVVIAVNLAKLDWPPDRVQLYYVALFVAVPIVNLVSLWTQWGKRKGKTAPLKNVSEKLDQMQMLLEKMAEKS